MTVLETALELGASVLRLIGLAIQPDRNHAQERYELLRMQRLTTDAIARKEIENS